MQLGFVTAILPELSLAEVAQFAAETGYDCIEVMCWPVSKAERRYAGVTHIDVVGLTAAEAARINDAMKTAGVAISGLGYYPNPLAPDSAEAQVYIDHLKQVILAARLLGVGVSGLGAPVRQLGLWDVESEKSRKLQEAVDVLQERYGRAVIGKGPQGDR